MAVSLLLRGIGGGLITVALIEAGQALALWRARRGAGDGQRRRLSWYAQTAAGRRLAGRLRDADVDLSPGAWRRVQLVAGAALVAMVIAVGAPNLIALAIASTLVRVGGWLGLRILAGRADEAVERAAVELARHLATELGAGANAAEAIASAQRLGACARSPAARRLLEHAAARVAVGGRPVVCLSGAVDALPDGRGQLAMRGLVAHLELISRSGIGTGEMVRFAVALAADSRARADARAQVAEVRLSAMCVPLLAVAAGVLLLTGGGGLKAILTPAILAIVAICMLVTASAVGLVRRLTAL